MNQKRGFIVLAKDTDKIKAQQIGQMMGKNVVLADRKEELEEYVGKILEIHFRDLNRFKTIFIEEVKQDLNKEKTDFLEMVFGKFFKEWKEAYID